MSKVDNEKAIRAIVASCIQSYASGFSDRHISERDDDVFIKPLNPELHYNSALTRCLDSALINLLKKMAINIASLHYTVSQRVEGVFPENGLCTNRDFWNQVCKSDKGYEIVLDEYKKNLQIIRGYGY